MFRITILAQVTYYFITGLWPIIHISSFMAVTGPKNDLWLVRMVALLSLSISLALLMALMDRIKPRFLAWGTAVSFLSIDCIYVTNQTISPVYLADAAVQLIFILMLIITHRKAL